METLSWFILIPLSIYGGICLHDWTEKKLTPTKEQQECIIKCDPNQGFLYKGACYCRGDLRKYGAK